MEEIRAQIDEIDSRLLQLLAKRFELSRKMATIKRNLKLPALDERRFDAMIKSRSMQAQELGLDEGMVQKIFEAIHSSSVDAQKGLIDGKI